MPTFDGESAPPCCHTRSPASHVRRGCPRLLRVPRLPLDEAQLVCPRSDLGKSPGGLVCQLLLMPGVDTGCVSVDGNEGTLSIDSQGWRSCGSHRELPTTLNYRGTHLRSSSADKSHFSEPTSRVLLSSVSRPQCPAAAVLTSSVDLDHHCRRCPDRRLHPLRLAPVQVWVSCDVHRHRRYQANTQLGTHRQGMFT